MTLPISPPYPPMEAKRVDRIPSGEGWLFEPKWDGFRAIVFRDGDRLHIQSKAGTDLTRYFPELVDAFVKLKSKEFILDGEIVIQIEGALSFDDLLLRMHPAEKRIRELARQIPASYFAFDLLYLRHPEPRKRQRAAAAPTSASKRSAADARDYVAKMPIEKRRAELEKFFAAVKSDRVHLSPATTDRKVAQTWFNDFGSIGLDGIMAKRLGEPYHSGDREGMVKVKHLKTADCVVGGFRYGEGTKSVGSLLLGLYDDEGHLVHVGHTSSIRQADRAELTRKLEKLRAANPFEVRVPGGPSRWATSKSAEWEAVKPALVCEVEYDYYSQGRFRHGSKFLRWRPDKKPKQCTLDQVER